uniref:TrkA family potassium uptake protein n=1 Tax=Muribaculaceae bacterium Z82 TaxID=2304548 RepID=A0A7C9JQ48_9BACT
MGRNVRVIVVGCGAFGSAVARSLSSGGNEVIAVDMREEAFDQLGDDFDGETVTGDGSSALLLQECGVERATHLVAATGHDATNLLIAELASEVFGVRHVLPVVDDESLVEILEDRGIEPLCPHRICEEEFFRLSRLARGTGGLR